MTDPAAAPSRIPWPPLIYLVALAFGTLAFIVYPVAWIGEPLSDILFATGCLLVLVTVAIYISALRALRRGKTTVSPVRAADHLVTNGAFSFSRNPLYLANTILLVGIGLVAGSIWFLILAVLASFATSKLAIEPEERHLKAKFGKRYLDYAKRVRRWV